MNTTTKMGWWIKDLAMALGYAIKGGIVMIQ
jgi:hypothetical protein